MRLQHPDIRDLLAERSAYLAHKTEVITSIIQGYSPDDMPTEAFRTWLDLCVCDAELIAEIWDVFERELALYYAGARAAHGA